MGLSKQRDRHTERSEVSNNTSKLRKNGLASLNRKNDFFTSFRMTTYETAPGLNKLTIHNYY